jgi:hypothetical protein
MTEFDPRFLARKIFWLQCVGMLALAIVVLHSTSLSSNASQTGNQETFATLQEALPAVIKACEQDDTAALLRLFGPEGKDIVESGDRRQDKEGRAEFVEAARAVGETDSNILFRYLLPNSMAPIIIQTTLRMATVLLTASGLSFLGLGVQPPTAEWGAMLSNARAYLITAPHVAMVPGLAIMLVVMGFNLFGDGLRDSLDPRLRD